MSKNVTKFIFMTKDIRIDIAKGINKTCMLSIIPGLLPSVGIWMKHHDVSKY